MDLTRRNVIVTENDSICLLDWDSAGFFPRFYEAAAIQCYNDSAAYWDGLLEDVNAAVRHTDEENDCIALIMKARAASLRYML